MSSVAVSTGQLGTVAATIFTPDAGAPSMTLSALFHNTSASLTETVTIVTNDGTNSRRVCRAVLAPNEYVRMRWLTLIGGTVLQGSTTDASVVDYYVTNSDVPEIVSLDANGAVKQVNSGVVGNQTLTGLMTSVGVANTGTETDTPGGSTAAAGSTTTDAGVLPAGTSCIYPTTAADGTKGVRVSATDKVTGRLIFIGNGVSTAVLKVYAPTGGAINGAAADAAFSGASGKGVIIYCLSGSGNTWLAW